MKTSVLVALAMTVTLAACGGGSRSSNSDTPVAHVPPPSLEPQNRTYSGPGSRWDVNLNTDATFLIERRASIDTPVILEIEGNYQALDNGFVQFFVSNAVGEDAPIAGDTAWAVEVQDFAIFLKPTESPFAGYITMIDSGSCPVGNLDASWIAVKTASTAEAVDDHPHMGAFTYDSLMQSVELSGRFALNGSDLGSLSIGQGTCQDGVLMTDRGPVYLADAGGGLVHTAHEDPAEREILFAMESEPLTSISDIDGEYLGLYYEPNNPVADNVSPTLVSCSAGVCNGQILDGLDAALSVSSYELNLFGTLDNPVAGTITGSIGNGSEISELACQIRLDVGSASQKLVTCIAQNPVNPNEHVNILLTDNPAELEG